jgi:dipeptidyl aminopeptidase/acylaminoacyl peptidase
MTEAILNNNLAGSGNHGNVDVAEVAQAAATAAAVVRQAGRNWQTWAKAGIIAFSALSGGTAATVTAVSAVVAHKATRPQRRKPATVLDSPLLPPEQVSFKSLDGLNINGYFYPNLEARAVLIMCHGFHGAAHDVHEAALMVQAAGYNALTFDFRGCGASEGTRTSVGFWEVQDALGAVEYVKTRPEVDPEQVALYGYSMGGATALMTAEQCPDIKAVITDCAFASLDTIVDVNFRYFYRLPKFPFAGPAVWWSRRFARIAGKRVDPVESLQKMAQEGRSLPHLIIHGQKDKAIPVSEACLLYEASPGPKELWIVPDADHVVAAHHDHGAYLRRIDEFLRMYLKG